MAKYKLLALDFDGTILPYGGVAVLQPRMLEALRAAQRAGVVICAATGRSLLEASPVLRAVPEFTYGVMGNGSEVYRLPGELLDATGFSQPECDAVMGVLRQHPDAMVQAFIGPTPYCEEHIRQDPSWQKLIEAFAAMTETKALTTPSFDELFAKHGPPCKIFTVAHSAAHTHEIAQGLRALGIVEVTGSDETNVEALPLGVNKAKGLRTVCAQLGIEPHEVMAIGDSSNDVAMLSFAGLGVAMGNATDDVKAVARRQTASIEENGAALAIERWLLAEEPVPCHP